MLCAIYDKRSLTSIRGDVSFRIWGKKPLSFMTGCGWKSKKRLDLYLFESSFYHILKSRDGRWIFSILCSTSDYIKFDKDQRSSFLIHQNPFPSLNRPVVLSLQIHKHNSPLFVIPLRKNIVLPGFAFSCFCCSSTETLNDKRLTCAQVKQNRLAAYQNF